MLRPPGARIGREKVPEVIANRCSIELAPAVADSQGIPHLRWPCLAGAVEGRSASRTFVIGTCIAPV